MSIRCCPAHDPPSLGLFLGHCRSIRCWISARVKPLLFNTRAILTSSAQKRPKRPRNRHGSRIQTEWPPHGTPPLLPIRLAFSKCLEIQSNHGVDEPIQSGQGICIRKNKVGQSLAVQGSILMKHATPETSATSSVNVGVGHTTTWPRHPRHRPGSPTRARPWPLWIFLNQCLLVNPMHRGSPTFSSGKGRGCR